jgi:hypothetical protein
MQLFDGLGAVVFGMLFPLTVADITWETGHYTTSLGPIGLAIGGGAVAAGLIADDLGAGAAFLSLAAVRMCASIFVMPETRIAAEM